MSAATVKSRYEHFSFLHQDFFESYQVVNQYVSELYTKPKKFISETSPALNNLLREISIPRSPEKNNPVAGGVVEFISELDKFTVETVQLFEAHKNHVSESVNYLNEINRLKTENKGKKMYDFALDYIQLTPQLHKLNNGLTQIKLNADNMADKLELLELRWERIKRKMQ